MVAGKHRSHTDMCRGGAALAISVKGWDPARGGVGGGEVRLTLEGASVATGIPRVAEGGMLERGGEPEHKPPGRAATRGPCGWSEDVEKREDVVLLVPTPG